MDKHLGKCQIKTSLWWGKSPANFQQSRSIPWLLTFHALTLHVLFQIVIISQPLITDVANVGFWFVTWSLMRKMSSSQVPILIQSRGMSLLLSGILFRIALYQNDQTYKFWSTRSMSLGGNYIEKVSNGAKIGTGMYPPSKWIPGQ